MIRLRFGFFGGTSYIRDPDLCASGALPCRDLFLRSRAVAGEYGMLFYLEKGDYKTGLKYSLQSAKQGCELAYGDIGSILYLEKK